MAEKIFDKQINFGWGLSFNMTGKAPTIAKRIFDTLADAEEYVNDFNDSAVEGLLLSVVADNEQNNGVYFVQSIKRNADDENAVLVKVSFDNIEEIKNLINDKIKKLENSNIELQANIDNLDKLLVSTKTEIEGAINDVQESVNTNTQTIIDNKNVIDNYTINEKAISENPVLNTDDLVISDNYSLLNQTAGNVYPGDIITTALSKIEVMLANTTLAMTAAINDLELKIGSPSIYDEEGNLVKPAYGLYQKYEELKNTNNLNPET
jgi:hypothetical protein